MVAGLVTGESIVNPDTMFENNGVNPVIGRVESVDPKNKSVTLAGGREVPYDKLVLGLGSRPFIPPIEGSDLEGVFTLRRLKDAEDIIKFIEENGARKLVFIGAGFISMEQATLFMENAPGKYDISSHPPSTGR